MSKMDNIRVSIHHKIVSILLPIELSTASTTVSQDIINGVDNSVRYKINKMVARIKIDKFPNEWLPRF